MKKLIVLFIAALFGKQTFAQMLINDEAMRYQEERMVYKQWDQNKFKPSSGFLGLNPYYWLTWGLMPSYKKTDLRPLGPNGPQTQRLALVAAMNSTDNSYKLHADTLRNSALSDMANQSGLITGADPLWLLYYSQALQPVLNYSDASILGPLPANVRQKVVDEGLYNWYTKELAMLKERISAAHDTDIDRGARILAYHRMLMEYRVLAATWATRIASAAMTIKMTGQQAKARNNQVPIVNWTPQTDIEIAKQVLSNRKY